MKRTHSVDYDIADGSPSILARIYPALLAHILQWAWPNTANIARVCRGFAMATRDHIHYWLPAMRRELTNRLPVRCAPSIALANPFIEFPRSLYVHLPWPWWHWIQWMFDETHSSIRSSRYPIGYGFIITIHEGNASCINFTSSEDRKRSIIYVYPNGNNPKSGYNLSYGYIDGGPQHDTGWVIYINKKMVFFDGYIASKKRERKVRYHGHTDVNPADGKRRVFSTANIIDDNE